MTVGLVVERYDATFTTRIDSYALKASSGSIELNEMGNATIVVPNDSLTALPADGQIMVLKVQPDVTDPTTERWGAFRVEKVHRVGVAKEEGDGHRTSIIGRSVLSDLDRALVQPLGTTAFLPDHTEVVYDWRHPEYPRGAYTPAFLRAVVSDVTALLPHGLAGFPTTFPNPETNWLAPNADPGDGEDDPLGLWYAHFDYGILEDQVWECEGTGDNEIVLAVDGVTLISFTENPDTADHHGTFHREVHIPIGTHSIDLRGNNQSVAPDPLLPFPNTSLMALAVRNKVTGEWLFSTSTPGWTCLDRPAEAPGFTPGRVVESLVAKAQAVGQMPGWTLSCDGANQSNGVPWPTKGQFTFTVGDSIISALFRMRDEGWIDFNYDLDTLTLNVYDQGTLGTDKSGTYTTAMPADEHDDMSWLVQLEHENDYSAVVGKILARDDNGWLYRGSGARAQKLTLADVTDRDAAIRAVDQTLDRVSVPDRTITVEMDPPAASAVPRPSTWWIGDHISVPNEANELEAVRFVGLTWDLGDEGLRIVPQFVSLKKDRLARLARVQARMIGALGGRSEAATVVSKLQPAQTTLQDQTVDWSWSGPADGGDDGDPLAGPSPIKKLDHDMDALVLGLKSKLSDDDDPPTGTTTMEIFANGVSLGTVSLGPGETGDTDLSGFTNEGRTVIMTKVARGALIHALPTSVGTHPNGTVSLYGALVP